MRWCFYFDLLPDTAIDEGLGHTWGRGCKGVAAALCRILVAQRWHFTGWSEESVMSGEAKTKLSALFAVRLGRGSASHKVSCCYSAGTPGSAVVTCFWVPLLVAALAVKQAWPPPPLSTAPLLSNCGFYGTELTCLILLEPFLTPVSTALTPPPRAQSPAAPAKPRLHSSVSISS